MADEYGLQAAYIIIAVALSIYIIAKAFTDYWLRRKLIDLGHLSEKSLASLRDTDRYTSLKWGLILLFAGLGLIILEYLPVSEMKSLPYGLLLLCISTGFLLYYKLAVGRQGTSSKPEHST